MALLYKTLGMVKGSNYWGEASFFIKRFVSILLMAAVILFGSFLCRYLRFGDDSIVLVWIPSGFAVTGLLIFGRWLWPGIWLGEFINDYVFLMFGYSNEQTAVVSSGLIALGLTVHALVACVLIERFVANGKRPFANPQDALVSCLAMFFCGALSATSGSIGLWVETNVIGKNAFDFSSEFFWRWWLSDSTGAVIVAPFLLTALERPWRTWSFHKRIEAFFLILLLGLISISLFGGWLRANLNWMHILTPFLLWGSFRFFQFGAASVTLLVSLVANLGTIYGYGPFVREYLASEEELTALRSFLCLTAVTHLCLSAATRTIRDSKAKLEEKVSKRTAELQARVWELNKAQTQLRALSRKIVSAQESERKRIAKEVHDDFGQALSALKIHVSWLGEHLEDKAENLEYRIEKMLDLIDMTIRSVRQLARELRPSVLDHLGLEAAIQSYVTEFQDREGVSCHLVLPEEGGLSVAADHSLSLYRITQEALTNISKHAHASKVDVVLEAQRERGLRLTIRDNGKGLSQKDQADPVAFGIVSMRERALACNGRLRLQSNPGKGTVLEVTIPAS